MTDNIDNLEMTEVKKNRFWFRASLILTALFIFIGICVGLGSAATCNGTGNVINSTTISNGCTIDTSGVYSMAQGTYVFNGTSTGVMRIQASNVWLNMNGSTLIGNNSGESAPNLRGIYSNNRINVSIFNGTIIGYRNGIELDNISNSNFYNMTFFGGRNAWVITGSGGTNSSNLSFYNSLFLNQSNCVFFQNAIGISIYNNSFSNTTLCLSSDIASSLLANGSIYNNTFIGPSSTNYHITMNNVTNVNIYNNRFYNNTRFGFISLDDPAMNVYITNNTFDLHDRAIYFADWGNNILIQGNTFNNSYLNADFYEAPIVMQGQRGIASSVQNWTNLSIINNGFYNFGCNGIVLRDVFNLNVSGNYFNQDLNFLLTKPYSCFNEPFTAIFIHEAYKGFIPSGSLASDNYTVASNHSSSNIFVTQNTFSNVNVYLRTQGTSNVNTDISNYWYKSYWNYFSLDRDEFWISNDWNNLTVLFNSSASGQGGPLLTTFYSTAAGSRPIFNVSITKDYEYYLRINVTNGNLLGLFNKSNALISFSNGSVACSNVNSCDNNINITLTPNNYSYVFDNANLTEGVSRSNFPLTFNSQSQFRKTISSSIVPVNNLPVIFSATCNNIGNVYYTDTTGSRTRFDGDNFCANEQLTFTTLSNLGQGASFDLEYGCDTFAETGFSLIMILSSLAILVFMLTFIYRKGIAEIEIGDIVILAIGVIITVVFWNVAGQNLGGACGPVV